MEKYNEIIEAGHLADMSNTKASLNIAQYYMNPMKISNDQLPMMSYGLQLDRIADAPPTSLVDTESHLKNQYDILGKSGYVYKGEKSSENILNTHLTNNSSILQNSLPDASIIKDFFNPISGRNFQKFSGKTCNNINIWRNDVNIVQAPSPTRYEYIDTRALIKDKIDSSKNNSFKA